MASDRMPAVPAVAGVPVGHVSSQDESLHRAELGRATSDTTTAAAAVARRPTVVLVVEDLLDSEELLVLNYRRSVYCFAAIDALFTLVNGATAVTGLMSSGINENTLGYKCSRHYWVLGFVGLVFLVGPVCGVVGAAKLSRAVTVVYVVLCVVKTVFQVALSFLTPFLSFLVTAIIQLWITRIVFQFSSTLGTIAPKVRKQLLDPEYIQNVRVTLVYW